jgi:hypothetical protein
MVDLRPQELEARRLIYDRVFSDCKVPSKEKLASLLGIPVQEMTASLDRLAGAHMLALQRDGEILMANPFSAVPTPFVVIISGRSWFANCILGRDGRFGDAACGCDDRSVMRLLRHFHETSFAAGLQGGRASRSFRRPCPAMVERHRLQLKDHASLPVGRACGQMVSRLASSTRRGDGSGYLLALGKKMVRHRSSRPGLATLHRRGIEANL